MNGLQGLKRQLIPLVKGSPIILICGIVAFYIARKVISYTPNSYQTVARIKLDDQKYGFSNTQLYKDFDLFSTTSKIQSEAEVLQSPLLIGQALKRVDFGVSIYRVGQLKNTLLYQDSPIQVEHNFKNSKNLDSRFWIRVVDSDHYQIGLVDESMDTLSGEKLAFGSPAFFQGESITISKNDSLLQAKNLHLIGLYECIAFSHDGLIADVSDKLNVAAIDKEIPVLRVVYKDQNAQKVADLANALCHAYIEDYVVTKTGAASQTVNFLDQKIEEVSKELQAAEIRLEQYKAKNGVVNTRQETETGLRQQSDLEVQLINLEMNEKAILELEEYINNGDYFNETAINFGFGDLLMTELVKKLKTYQDERQDLIFKYTAESDQVRAIDAKILEVKEYIREAIVRNKKEIIIKREAIEKTVEINSKQFDGLSTREKEMRILERDFAMKEQVYTFLAQKKIEASIAASALLSFHRIIQPAVVPQKPVSPNKTLIQFVSVVLGLIVGVGFVLLRKTTLSKIETRDDLEKRSGLPILGLVRKGNSADDCETLCKSLRFKGQLSENPLVVISSAVSGEGRSLISEGMSFSLAKMGYSVALLTFQDSLNNQSFEAALSSKETPVKSSVTRIKMNSEAGLQLQDQLNKLRKKFDIVLVDAPASAISIAGIEFMKLAQVNLFLFRANFTSTHLLEYPELLAEEYAIDNIQLVLNEAHMASSFNGRFIGVGYNNHLKSTRWTQRFWNHLNAYIAS